MIGLRPRTVARRPDDRAELYAPEPNGVVIHHSGPVALAAHPADVVVPPTVVRHASRSRITVDETYTVRPNADIDTERFTRGHQPIPRPVYDGSVQTQQTPWDGARRIVRGTLGQWDSQLTVSTNQLNAARGGSQ